MPAASGKKKKSDTREQIISVAKSHFARYGFEAASTRNIAKEADVSQPLLLYYFDSKETLWQSILDDLFTALAGSYADFEPEEDATTKELLVARITALTHFFRKDPDLHRIMTSEGKSESERLSWMLDKYMRANYDRMLDLLKKGQKEGVVRPFEPTLIYYSIIGIAGTFYSLEPEMHLLGSKSKNIGVEDVAAIIKNMVFVDE